jgi:hypothetical protein
VVPESPLGPEVEHDGTVFPVVAWADDSVTAHANWSGLAEVNERAAVIDNAEAFRFVLGQPEVARRVS